MSYYRQARKRDEFHLMTSGGPVVVKVKCGRACIEIEAAPEVKIHHKKRDLRLHSPRKRV